MALVSNSKSAGWPRGLGDSFVEPLLLDERGEQRQGSRAYASEEGDRLVCFRRRRAATGSRSTASADAARSTADYEEMCHFQQTSPERTSPETRLHAADARRRGVTLSGLRFITTDGDGRHERELAGGKSTLRRCGRLRVVMRLRATRDAWERWPTG